ncbi:MAG: sulfite exporter TauE/SafE family protein [Gammaproteobacteria bacterium]|nr:sulfite exporter TauE/SafE family protein [Gammaproteobacteria bacterium]
MTDSLPLIAAFFVGFAGSAHCIGMCGGIVGTLGSCLPPARRPTLLGYHLIYSLGRISSYVIAGALVGLAGHSLLSLFPPQRAHAIGFLVSGTFMIVLGLYLSGVWNGLALLEKQGGRIWQRVAPLTHRLLPIDRPRRALALGLLWGWLPCGLVYSALAWAATTGGPAQGAALMAAFGAGTLPMLMVMGTAATWLDRVRQNLTARRLAGGLILLLGVLTVTGLVNPIPSHGPAADAAPHDGHTNVGL